MTREHIEAWFDGAPLSELPAGTEALLREICRYHAAALGRATDDMHHLTMAFAYAAESALSMGSTAEGELYAHGLTEGLSRAAVAAGAMRDALNQHLDNGVTE